MIAGHSENNNGTADHLSAFKLAHETMTATNGKGNSSSNGGGAGGGAGQFNAAALAGYSSLFPSLYSPGLQHLHHLLSQSPAASPSAAAVPSAGLGFNPTMLLNAQLALAAQQVRNTTIIDVATTKMCLLIVFFLCFTCRVETL